MTTRHPLLTIGVAGLLVSACATPPSGGSLAVTPETDPTTSPCGDCGADGVCVQATDGYFCTSYCSSGEACPSGCCATTDAGSGVCADASYCATAPSETACTDLDYCVTSVTPTWGQHCGSDTSVQVSFANSCDRDIWVKMCLEVVGGGWDCTGQTIPARGTSDSGAWTCDATGRYVAQAIPAELFSQCPVPNP